jgi:hypothetical protein
VTRIGAPSLSEVAAALPRKLASAGFSWPGFHTSIAGDATGAGEGDGRR